MKKFTFRLEALLTVKKNAEEEIKRRLAEKNNEAELVRREISAAHDNLKDFQTNVKSERGAGGENISAMRSSVAHRNHLKLELLRAGQKLDNVMVAIYGINQELIKAAQERRAVEIIKEKRYEEWKRENAVAEQKFIDDLSQQRFIRSHNNNT
ncbi:MAG: flagellar export protein FliJ [Chitinispirillia bacterium]|nr:flagellar export protein FliJ [Chitinispirillia bacterium]MCL2241319.1 flagellar export protein FliJ [Chitinispirillia bacterium]